MEKLRGFSFKTYLVFVHKLGVQIELDGFGTITADTSFGGDSFVAVDANEFGFSIDPNEAADLARLGAKITDAANEQIGFEHPTLPDWNHYSFCQFTANKRISPKGVSFKSAVAIKPGKIDRSPTGTALSAQLAVLAVRKQIEVGTLVNATSIIGSVFGGK